MTKSLNRKIELVRSNSVPQALLSLGEDDGSDSDYDGNDSDAPELVLLQLPLNVDPRCLEGAELSEVVFAAAASRSAGAGALSSGGMRVEAASTCGATAGAPLRVVLPREGGDKGEVAFGAGVGEAWEALIKSNASVISRRPSALVRIARDLVPSIQADTSGDVSNIVEAPVRVARRAHVPQLPLRPLSKPALTPAAQSKRART